MTSEPVTEQSTLDEFLSDGQSNDAEDEGENADEDCEMIRPLSSYSEAKGHLEELPPYFEASSLTKDPVVLQ